MARWPFIHGHRLFSVKAAGSVGTPPAVTGAGNPDLSVDPVRSPLQDARAADLKYEPDLVLQALAQGHMGATVMTSRLAQQELDWRRLTTTKEGAA